MTSLSRWIELEGAVNVRDLGSLPTVDGRTTQSRRLIRSDNLQSLSEADVRWLVDELVVRSIVDLRTGIEIESEGPGPLQAEPLISIRHFSLFQEKPKQERPEVGSDAAKTDGVIVLPWQNRSVEVDGERRRPTATEVYLSYLTQRPDSLIEALRVVAYSEGATIVHCAAGKDRTGIVVALALEEVGVERESVIEDYALTAERIEAIMMRLGATGTYSGELRDFRLDPAKVDKHTPRAETMRETLAAIDENYGGAGAFLRSQGWNEDDARALRSKLLG
jgi:protein tyrosine/serine phosphatase